MAHRRLQFVLAGLLVVAAPRALPQNLLQNPGFASNLGGWTVISGPVAASWSSTDANGSASSGSAQLTQSNATAGQPAAGLGQCVAVVGGTAYTVALRARVLTGAAGNVSTGGYTPVNFYESGDCSGDLIGGYGPNSVGGGGVFAPNVGSVTAPASAHSAEVMLALAPFANAPTLTVLFDDIVFAPQRSETLTIPASASIHGANGTFFHSDLWIVNKSYTYAVAYEMTFRCFSGMTCGSGKRTFGVPPRGSAFFTDALNTIFAAQETAGALEIRYDAALGGLAVSSRVYTPSLPAPTNGSGIPALATTDARTRAVFPGLGGSGGNTAHGFRSNAGAYNPNPTPVEITFTLRASDGTLIGAPLVRAAGAHEAFQINDVFASAGAGGTVTTNAYLVVTAPQPVFGYVTLIDNQSGDSVYINAQQDTTP